MQLALDCRGCFLDVFGSEAAALQWTPRELFDVATGLVWRLAGGREEAIRAAHARSRDGRTIGQAADAERLKSRVLPATLVRTKAGRERCLD
jgi:hypothetical protein